MAGPASSRPGSPTKQYDTYWPAATAESGDPTSPPSPSKRMGPGPPAKERSPKHRLLMPVKHTRSSAHQLQSIKEKMPLLLKLISSLETGFLDPELSFSQMRSGSLDDIQMDPHSSSANSQIEISIVRRHFNALGLILGTGYSKTKAVRFFV